MLYFEAVTSKRKFLDDVLAFGVGFKFKNEMIGLAGDFTMGPHCCAGRIGHAHPEFTGPVLRSGVQSKQQDAHAPAHQRGVEPREARPAIRGNRWPLYYDPSESWQLVTILSPQKRPHSFFLFVFPFSMRRLSTLRPPGFRFWSSSVFPLCPL